MTVGRRELIQTGLLVTLPSLVTANANGAAQANTADPHGPAQAPSTVVKLWPGTPPGGEHVTVRQSEVADPNDPNRHDVSIFNTTTPTLRVFRPEKPNGAAILIIPGGGYRNVVIAKEGYDIAQWLTGEGITAFVLLYRLPADGWIAGPDTPLQDAQRAMRLVRHQAGQFGLDPARVGVIGFSAGGHLAARLATRFDPATYVGADEADHLSARPDLAALVYPVISFKEGTAHMGSREQALGRDPSPARIEAYSAEVGVPASAPPTFLVHAADDGTVPVENSLWMFQSLRKAKVPAALHVFETGGHGFALRTAQNPSLATWPGLFVAWCREHRFMERGAVRRAQASAQEISASTSSQSMVTPGTAVSGVRPLSSRWVARP